MNLHMYVWMCRHATNTMYVCMHVCESIEGVLSCGCCYYNLLCSGAAEGI